MHFDFVCILVCSCVSALFVPKIRMYKLGGSLRRNGIHSTGTNLDLASIAHIRNNSTFHAHLYIFIQIQ